MVMKLAAATKGLRLTVGASGTHLTLQNRAIMILAQVRASTA
jgi:hypothetical protein